MRVEGNGFAVVGGSGFVGSHLVDLLVARGAARVVVLDQIIRDDNLAAALRAGRVECLPSDVTDRAALDGALTGVQGVFHLAALPLGACNQDPDLAIRINVHGVLNVIQAAQQAGVKRLVYSSASSVYGDTLEKMDEAHPLRPNTLYGATKLCGEVLLQAHAGRLPFVALRYMNVYGPRQEQGLIPSVARRILAGQPPVIAGDGSASFDFVYVTDVAECNVLAMQSETSAEAFNVGSDAEASVTEIVTSMLHIASSKLTPTYDKKAQSTATRRVGKSDKARKLLGYRPGVDLEDGLRRTWEALAVKA